MVLGIELGFHSNREFKLGRWVLKNYKLLENNILSRLKELVKTGWILHATSSEHDLMID